MPRRTGGRSAAAADSAAARQGPPQHVHCKARGAGLAAPGKMGARRLCRAQHPPLTPRTCETGGPLLGQGWEGPRPPPGSFCAPWCRAYAARSLEERRAQSAPVCGQGSGCACRAAAGRSGRWCCCHRWCRSGRLLTVLACLGDGQTPHLTSARFSCQHSRRAPLTYCYGCTSMAQSEANTSMKAVGEGCCSPFARAMGAGCTDVAVATGETCLTSRQHGGCRWAAHARQADATFPSRHLRQRRPTAYCLGKKNPHHQTSAKLSTLSWCWAGEAYYITT